MAVIERLTGWCPSCRTQIEVTLVAEDGCPDEIGSLAWRTGAIYFKIDQKTPDDIKEQVDQLLAALRGSCFAEIDKFYSQKTEEEGSPCPS
jgi:hypothetical protein